MTTFRKYMEAQQQGMGQQGMAQPQQAQPQQAQPQQAQQGIKQSIQQHYNTAGKIKQMASHMGDKKLEDFADNLMKTIKKAWDASKQNDMQNLQTIMPQIDQAIQKAVNYVQKNGSSGGGNKPDYQSTNLQGKVPVSFKSLETIVIEFQKLRKMLQSGDVKKAMPTVQAYENMLLKYIEKKKGEAQQQHGQGMRQFALGYPRG